MHFLTTYTCNKKGVTRYPFNANRITQFRRKTWGCRLIQKSCHSNEIKISLIPTFPFTIRLLSKKLLGINDCWSTKLKVPVLAKIKTNYDRIVNFLSFNSLQNSFLSAAIFIQVNLFNWIEWKHIMSSLWIACGFSSDHLTCIVIYLLKMWNVFWITKIVCLLCVLTL